MRSLPGGRRRAGRLEMAGLPHPYFAGRRLIIVAAMRAGCSAREAAARFGVSAASAARWRRLAERTGSVEPGRPGGRGRRMLGPHRDWLRDEVAAQPGITLAALRAGLRERGVEASRDTVWRFLWEEGLGVGERGGKLPDAAARGR